MRILVAVDESEGSERVASFVNAFMPASRHEVLALNVASDPVTPPLVGWALPTDRPVLVVP